ncbi:MAG TPA: His/Gly/Thr/Pro-type tRNA ligase C-terminal domain-containing protein, partial [Phycisphaerae bacterium]|nr:His/Gly/Thr/Pro-type tRNA ligase C-terminal domain-containing protein [Phycisphaerae bacterium]
WLSPVQARVLPVSEKTNDFGRQVVDRLRSAGLRAELDDSPDKVGAKIRRATLDKVPYMLVVGPKEVDAGAVSVRERTAGDLGAMPLDRVVEALAAEVAGKSLTSLLAKPEG